MKPPEKLPEVTNVWQLVAWYSTKHGALVFGVITVLTMWLIMVVPELERNQMQAEVHRVLLEELRQHTKDQREISEHLKTTSEILDRITLTMGPRQ